MAAAAADAADDVPRALMMAAPRCCTVGIKLSLNQPGSTNESAGLPPTVAWCRSGYWVAEWLPQMMTLLTVVNAAPLFSVSCASPRLWSRRVIAVNRLRGREGALRCAMSELVLAGLPTTSTRTSRLACVSSALPCAEKILAFSNSKSLRSMPGPRGLERKDLLLENAKIFSAQGKAL